MRISAHILRGDVKFFPCASAVGVSPSARRGEKRGAFRENVGGAHGLARRAHGLGAAARRMAADELTGVYEGRALRALMDEAAR